MSTQKNTSTRDDLRKALTDATPLYFAAGVLDKIRTEAPGRIAAMRETDPKAVQAKVSTQAREQAQQTQSRLGELLTGIDGDIKKLREQAQGLALQGVGRAAEYAVKARESYDEMAQRGRGAVKTWRAGHDETVKVTVERESVRVAEPPAGSEGKGTTTTTTTRKTSTATAGTDSKPTAEHSTAQKTTPPKPAAPRSGSGSGSGSSTAKPAASKQAASKPASTAKGTSAKSTGAASSTASKAKKNGSDKQS